MVTVRRIRSLAVIAIAVVLSTAVPPAPVHAAPGSDIWTFYYDCALNEVGQKFRGCDSTGFNWGQLSGAFKDIENCSCETTLCQDTWYEWNGSVWVPLSGPPSPSC